MKTPVALIFFRRPDLLAKVFAAVKKAKPSRLLLVADGPRSGKPGEAEACAAARKLASKVSWPCKVEKNFAPANMGCRMRVSSGINWIFTRVPEALILEDDCVPAPDFFRFAPAMLARYRRDERVMMVSGSNFLPDAWKGRADYAFSRHAFIWGWASWARAWKHYDLGMKGWLEDGQEVLRSLFPGSAWERLFWRRGMRLTYEGAMDTWDYQWIWAIWKRGGLSLVPRQNLISNIGAGEGASHGDRIGASPNLPLGRMPGPYRAPLCIAADLEYFKSVEAAVYSGDPHFNLLRRAKTVIKEFFGKN